MTRQILFSDGPFIDLKLTWQSIDTPFNNDIQSIIMTKRNNLLIEVDDGSYWITNKELTWWHHIEKW